MNRSLRTLTAAGLFMLAIGCTKDDDFVENKVPVADAGASKTVLLTDSAVLTGTGSDADGNVVAYLWSQVSGPAASTIVNPGSASTAVKFSIKGSYIFQLMVTDDKGATGVDTVKVTVNQATNGTLTLQPVNNPTEYTLVNLGGNDASGIAHTSLEADSWTAGGGTYNLRGLVKFDLSSIPTNATIKSATLYLYSDPKPNTGNQIDANFGTANGLYLQQVTSAWAINTVSWFNQPSVSTGNQISIAHTAQTKLDVSLDVTAHVASMVNNNANYGWLLRLQNEVTYNSRIFVSSRNPTYPDKRPKLVVVYE